MSVYQPPPLRFPEYKGNTIEEHQIHDYLKNVWNEKCNSWNRKTQQLYLSLIPRAKLTRTTNGISSHRVGKLARSKGATLPHFIVLNALFGRKACRSQKWWVGLKQQYPNIESEWSSGPFYMTTDSTVEVSTPTPPPTAATTSKQEVVEEDAMQTTIYESIENVAGINMKGKTIEENSVEENVMKRHTTSEDTMTANFPPVPKQTPDAKRIELPKEGHALAVAREVARKFLEEWELEKVTVEELARRFEEDLEISRQIQEQIKRIDEKINQLYNQFIEHAYKMDEINGRPPGTGILQIVANQWNVQK